MQSAERISHIEPSDHVIYQRSLFAYHKAAEMISGSILELGIGEGYGLEIFADKVERYTAIDKYKPDVIDELNKKIEFLQLEIPPFKEIKDKSCDFVVTFQVIEHIKKDELFIREIQRVLKPGGKLILTTPNKSMSLTRNPWHVREYIKIQLEALLNEYFKEVTLYGVYGNDKVMKYYQENKRSVEKITHFDILKLQYWLPAALLKLPYDYLNRANRKKLMPNQSASTLDISIEDYRLDHADDEQCFDFFAVGTK